MHITAHPILVIFNSPWCTEDTNDLNAETIFPRTSLNVLPVSECIRHTKQNSRKSATNQDAEIRLRLISAL
jgi:hypothetical protein